jgi:hypothetical protein
MLRPGELLTALLVPSRSAVQLPKLLRKLWIPDLDVDVDGCSILSFFLPL